MSARQANKGQAEAAPAEPTPEVRVSGIVGEGIDARRVVHVGNWTLFAPVTTGDSRPRISELEIGRHLEYARAESFVQVLDRLVLAEKFNENEFLHKSWENKPGRGRPRNARGERLLTLEQTILAITQADTPVSWALTRQISHVFYLAPVLAALTVLAGKVDELAIQGAASDERLVAIEQRGLAQSSGGGEISYEQDMAIQGEVCVLALQGGLS